MPRATIERRLEALETRQTANEKDPYSVVRMLQADILREGYWRAFNLRLHHFHLERIPGKKARAIYMRELAALERPQREALAHRHGYKIIYPPGSEADVEFCIKRNREMSTRRSGGRNDGRRRAPAGKA